MRSSGQTDSQPKRQSKVLIIICTQNAESTITSILDRLPQHVRSSEQHDYHLLIIDNASADATVSRAYAYRAEKQLHKLSVLRHPIRQGDGENQKVAFSYAIDNDFDVIALLGKDDQCAPETLMELIDPITTGRAAAVFGSRMLKTSARTRGTMPLYRRVGNYGLNCFLNGILRSHLSDFLCGQRAYSVPALKLIPFQHNSSHCDFNTDIAIQLLCTGREIDEIPIIQPSRGNVPLVECLINGYRSLRACIESIAQAYGIWYTPKFDFTPSNECYTAKLGYPSSHQFAVDYCSPSSRVLDLGCGPGHITKALWERGIKVFSIDRQIQPAVVAYSVETLETDIDDFDFKTVASNVNTILALDIIEHLKSPELFLSRLREAFGQQSPDVVITTGNIAFLPLRVSLLIGSFNYGPRGILDLDHKRLFTFSSLKRLLLTHGYEIVTTRGIPAPFPLIFEHTWKSRCLLLLNKLAISCSKGLFAYQIAFVVRPRPTLKHLLRAAQSSHTEKGSRTSV